MWKRGALTAFAFAMIVLVPACGGGGQREPPSTSAPTSSLGKIRTADGEYLISRVEVGDRFPADCSDLGPKCYVGPPDCSLCDIRLDEGAQVVSIWLEPEGEHPTLISSWDDLMRETYVAGNDGTRASCSGLHLDLGKVGEVEDVGDVKGLTLHCYGPASARELTLFVPGNPPVDLGK